MVSKRTNTKLIQEMSNIDLDTIAENVVEECKIQWGTKEEA